MQKFERAQFEVKEFIESENYGKFVIEPLERGFGTTIGNALRRVLLSSLPGGAIFSIKKEGVYHEFSSINGVKEDVTSIILNLKNVILKIEDDEIHTLRISKTGPGAVLAQDIICPDGVEVLNKDLYICNLEEDTNFEMELQAKSGRGYVSADQNKRLFQGQNQPLGIIYTDSMYSPVKRVSYASNTVETEGAYDTLTMEIDTDGTLMPSETLSIAAKILRDHLEILSNLDEEDLVEIEASPEVEEDETNAIQHRMIEDLELSVRSYNCLKRAGINTVEELCNRTPEDMMKVRNLGRKSLEEVLAKLKELGLELNPSEE